MPRPDDSEHSEPENCAPDTLDGILGAAFGREDTAPDGGEEAAETPEAIGPFRILRTLGRGGMGHVYLAEDTRLAHRRVAIKVLTAATAGEGPPRERLVREAEAASKLDHPGICAVYEVGEADGLPYIAMRYVEGEELVGKIRRAREALASGEHSVLLDPPDSTVSGADDHSSQTSTGARAETVRVIHLIEKAARALHVAHESHLVHRDVKPANIMVTPFGEPVLLDFGLARMADSDLPGLTRTGQLVGTPAYMAPEQIDAARGTIDRRTDIYGLGVTLYECLTLRQPFTGVTREQLYRNILEDEPTALRRIHPRMPKDLEAVVATALEKSPSRRYRTALDLAEDLRRVREQQPTKARPIRPLERAIRYARRRPTRAALFLLLLVGIPAVAWMAGYIVANRPMIEKQEAEDRRRKIEAHLRIGFDALLFKGDQTNAVAAFDAALAVDPSCVEAVGGKALALFEALHAEKCLAFLRDHEQHAVEVPALCRIKQDALKLLGRTDEALAVEIRPPATAFGFFLEGARLMRGFLTERRESKFRVALECFRMAVMSAREARPLYHRHLAQAASRFDEPKIGESVARAVTTAWPQSPAAWASACVALSRAEPEKALAAIDRAIVLDPDSSELHYKRSAILSRLDRDKEALAANERAVACDPKDATAWTGLGVNLMNLDRLDEAIKALEEATRLAPRWYSPWRRLGRALFRKARYTEALAAVNRALSLRDNDLEGWKLKGMTLDALKRPDDALAALGRALDLDDLHAPAHHAIGRIHYKGHRIEEAKAAFKKAIACDPGLARAYADLGIALRYGKHRDLNAALVMLGKAISLDKTNPTYRFYLGRAHQDNGEHTKAIGAYDQAIGLNPNLGEVYNNRGVAYYQLKQYDRAIGDATKAIELRPRYAEALGLLGSAHLKNNSLAEAEKALRLAEEYDATDPVFSLTLARVLKKDLQLEEALLAFDRCLAKAGPKWPHRDWTMGQLVETENRVRRLARDSAIVGFAAPDGTPVPRSVRARDLAVRRFDLLISRWRTALKNKGNDHTRAEKQLDELFDSPRFVGISESEPFHALPEEERARWLEVWRTLRELLG